MRDTTLAPVGKSLNSSGTDELTRDLQFGKLHIQLTKLQDNGGFTFEEITGEAAPRFERSPVLTRHGPWKQGDFVSVATVASPMGSEGSVSIKALPDGAAALMMEPDRRKAYLWVVNLSRLVKQYQCDLAPELKVRTFTRDIELVPRPADKPAYVGLLGAQSAVWVIESERAMDTQVILGGLEEGQGKESRPAKSVKTKKQAD